MLCKLKVKRRKINIFIYFKILSNEYSERLNKERVEHLSFK